MYKHKIFYKDKDFTVKIEEVEGELMVHVTFERITRTILDKALQVWSTLKAMAWKEGYEQISTYTKDDRMFKFFPFAENKGEVTWKGEQYKVATWALN